MATLNIRIGVEEEQMVKDLRKEGINLSAVVRQAIREKHGTRKPKRKSAKEYRAALDRLLGSIPHDEPRIEVDPSDRRAVSAYIRKRLEKERQ